MPIAKNYTSFIFFSGLTVIIYCTWVLILSLLLENSIVQPYHFGHLPMAIDSAFCFILSTVTLLYFCKKEQSKGLLIIFCKILPAIVVSCGTLSLLQHMFVDFPRESIINIHGIPLGMAPQTAACFILLGVAFYNLNNNKLVRIIQILLHFVTLMAFVVILGHLFDVPDFYSFTFITAMAIYSAVGFFILSVGAAFLNPHVGIIGIFTGQQVGHLMARKLFSIILAATVCAGYIRILAHRYGLVEVELGIALTILVFCLISLTSIWLTTKTLNKYEEKGRIAQGNLEIILDSAPYSIIKTNGEGRIVLANKQAEELFGFEKKMLIGQNLAILIPDRFHEMYKIGQKLLQVKEGIITFGVQEEIFAQDKMKREFPVEIRASPIQLQGRRAVILTLIDISRRKNQEKIIVDQLLELQHKNQELEHFNYISSHDLQEPLRTVLNYMDVIDDDYQTLDPQLQVYLKSVKDSVIRMSRIVKSLLDFGRLGRNRKMTYTDVDQIINNVTEDLQNMIKDSGANITVFGAMPKMYAYETELRQLFQNLISNAIKFRKPDEPPVIEISSSKVKGSYRFYVSDNGIGIEPKYFDRIFNIFQRLNREEDYEGHGIGLANCRKIAEMHGGKIWVKSEPGKGSTFVISILNFTK